MTSSAWEILPSTSKSWRSPEALQHLHLNTTIPVPSAKDLGDNQVLVRIKAASINARDMMVIAHDPIYPVRNIEGLSPCADAAGKIIATGKFSKWKIGDRVILHPLPGYTNQDYLPEFDELRGRGAGSVQGTLRQFGIFEDQELFPAPNHLTWEESAAIPSCGATAVNALFFSPVELKPRMSILTIGTGGVSCAAIQLASAAGLTVISTSSSNTKLLQARNLGAKHTINYVDNKDWTEEVLRVTRGKGVDFVLDVVGDLDVCLRCVKRGGVVCLVGFLGSEDKEGREKSDLVMDVLFRGIIVRGVLGFNTAHMEKLLEMTNQFQLRPLKYVFESEQAKEAFEMSMQRNLVRKIVIKV